MIVQYGGQTPLKLARDLEANGVPIIGTSPDSIDLAEDRERFQKLLNKLEAEAAAEPHRAQPPDRRSRSRGEIGYPLVVRPSLRARRPRDGNRARATRPRALHARSGQGVERLAGAARPLPRTTRSRSTSMRSRDGEDVLIGGIMEHIEQAGVHSGDSACSLPPYSACRRRCRTNCASRRSRWRVR